MKRLIITSMLLFTGISGEAMADCSPATQVLGGAVMTLISTNTVCATRGNEKWQEQHRSGGALWDYKKGPGDSVDPSKQVGTWIASRTTSSVTYSYTGGSSYTYTIHGPAGGPYSFCTGPNGTEVVSGATFKPGNNSCP